MLVLRVVRAMPVSPPLTRSRRPTIRNQLRFTPSMTTANCSSSPLPDAEVSPSLSSPTSRAEC